MQLLLGETAAVGLHALRLLLTCCPLTGLRHDPGVLFCICTKRFNHVIADCISHVPGARSGLRSGEQVKVVQKLQAAGCTVHVSTLDVADPAQAARLLADAGRRAPARRRLPPGHGAGRQADCQAGASRHSIIKRTLSLSKPLQCCTPWTASTMSVLAIHSHTEEMLRLMRSSSPCRCYAL